MIKPNGRGAAKLIAMVAGIAFAQVMPAFARTAEDRQLADYHRGHPRLFADEAAFSKLAGLVAENPRHQALFELVRKKADGFLDTAPVTYKKEGRRLLGVSREVLGRATALGLAAKVTGDERYRDRLLDELRTVCRFPDWNPSHFLDTAEMCLAVSIGYDWFYHDLPAEDRQLLLAAVRDFGLRASLAEDYAWISAENNWNQVCHGGMSAGAIAVFDEAPELAARILERAIENIHHAMDPYEPDGVYPEGPAYWSYGTSYNIVFLSLLDAAYGHTFGLLEGSALAKSPIYMVHITGPTGETFNYSDNSSNLRVGDGVLWLAKKTNQPTVAAMEEAKSERLFEQGAEAVGRLTPLRLLWMEDEEPVATTELPLSFHGRGVNPIATHRTSWTDPNALFIAVKAGSPHVNHGHMDTGSFVLEADGVRWALDLGAEGYHGIESRGMDLWNRSQESDRWTILRLNNLSHSTLVIGGLHQVVGGSAPITGFSDNPSRRGTHIDLTPVYEGQATSVRRSVAIAGGVVFEISDTLTGVAPGEEIRWGMVTRADVARVGEDGVRLVQSGRELWLEGTATGSENALQWEVYPLDPPPNEWDSPNPGAKLVGFTVRAEDGPISLRVKAIPGDGPFIRRNGSELR